VPGARHRDPRGLDPVLGGRPRALDALPDLFLGLLPGPRREQEGSTRSENGAPEEGGEPGAPALDDDIGRVVVITHDPDPFRWGHDSRISDPGPPRRRRPPAGKTAVRRGIAAGPKVQAICQSPPCPAGGRAPRFRPWERSPRPAAPRAPHGA